MKKAKLDEIKPINLIHQDFIPSIDFPVPSDIITQWRTEGYALIDGFFDEKLVNDAKSQMKHLLSLTDSITEDFGGISFPFSRDLNNSSDSNALNSIVLHPLILSLSKKLLKSDVHLIQGEAWMKKSNEDFNRSILSNQDQRMHMDYPNHTFLHPPSWEYPEVVAAILYLDDSDECGGMTAIVPNNGNGNMDPLYAMPYNKMPGVGKHKWMNDRIQTEAYFQKCDPDVFTFREQLYNKEKYAKFNKGTLLLYRHDIWHRGTPIIPGKTRLVLNLAYKKASSTWITCWGRGVATEAYDNLWGVLPTLKFDQQAALGIPIELAIDGTIDNRSDENSEVEHIKISNIRARYRDQI
jgi:hypothetical protein